MKFWVEVHIYHGYFYFDQKGSLCIVPDKKTALHNLNKQRPKEFPMQKMLEALFNKFIYLPNEGKLWWVFTELQVNLSPHLFTNFNWLFYSN